jgi:hypothetical protein
MIDKFRRDNGGIYQNEILTNYIKEHASTKRYCDGLEGYIKRKLKDNGGDVSKLEDNEVDWMQKDQSGKISIEMTNEYREKKGKTFSLTPQYNGISFFTISNEEKWKNTREGVAISVGDVWATEVIITEYELNECTKKYNGRYQVTLWDHFGLDAGDIDWNKPAGCFDGFMAWFILQHFRGYRPFITRMTFNKSFKGDLNDENT